MIDYIRKAVELADGWTDYQHSFICHDWFENSWDGPGQVALDALAAQLVRQVDAITHKPPISLNITEGETEIIIHHPCRCLMDCNAEYKEYEGPDRTLNTIKAIVDSKVLE